MAMVTSGFNALGNRVASCPFSLNAGRAHQSARGQQLWPEPSATLLAHPLAMSLNCRIRAQRLKGRQARCEHSLVVQSMNALVARSADPDATLLLLACVAFAETVAPMNLARDQVVKGQCGTTATQAAAWIVDNWRHGRTVGAASTWIKGHVTWNRSCTHGWRRFRLAGSLPTASWPD